MNKRIGAFLISFSLLAACGGDSEDLWWSGESAKGEDGKTQTGSKWFDVHYICPFGPHDRNKSHCANETLMEGAVPWILSSDPTINTPYIRPKEGTLGQIEHLRASVQKTHDGRVYVHTPDLRFVLPRSRDQKPGDLVMISTFPDPKDVDGRSAAFEVHYRVGGGDWQRFAPPAKSRALGYWAGLQFGAPAGGAGIYHGTWIYTTPNGDVIPRNEPSGSDTTVRSNLPLPGGLVKCLSTHRCIMRVGAIPIGLAGSDIIQQLQVTHK